jgi:multiple sugar transport system substrate-binding protein
MSPAGGSTDAFDAGKVGFYISGAWEIAQLKEDNPTMHWGVEPLPKGFPTGTTNGAFVDQNYNAIPKGAKNQAAAWEFMAWLAGFNNESYVAKAIQPFGQPSAPSVVGAPGYRTFLKSVPARNAFISVLSNPHDTFWPVSCVDAQLSTEETNVQQALLSTKMTAQGGASYLQKHMDAAKC